LLDLLRCGTDDVNQDFRLLFSCNLQWYRYDRAMKTLITLGIFLMLCAIPVHGQNLVAGSDTARSVVHVALGRFKTSLPTWSVVILDEAQWKQWGKTPHSIAAFSVIPGRVTFIRQGYILTHTPDQVVNVLAHEAGHLECNCESEERADELMVQLIDSHL